MGISWLIGSGPQPAEVMPSNSIGYVRVDFNPSGDQQLKAYNFLSNFPTVAEELGNEDDPLGKQLFEALQKDTEELGHVDYEEDVEPWLGDRLGVGMLPPSGDDGEPDAVIAVQVTDEGAAEEGFDKLFQNSEEKPSVAYLDGFALVHPDEGRAQALADSAAESNLASSENFGSDMDALGEDGIFSFWLDNRALLELGGSAEEMGVGAPGAPNMDALVENAGRLVGALRFEDRYVELAGMVVDAKQPVDMAGGGATSIAELPDSTIGAMAFSGGREGVLGGWDQALNQLGSTPEMQSMVEAWLQSAEQAGINLPDDLATLLGDSFAVAVDESALAGLAGMGDPAAGGQAGAGIGARIDTENPAEAEDVVRRLEEIVGQMAGMGQPELPPEYEDELPEQPQVPTLELATAQGDGVLGVAMEDGYAEQLTTAGALGDNDGFQVAVPDADSAQFAMYVDLATIIGAVGAGEDVADVEALQAIGISGNNADDGGTFTMRAVVK